MSLVILVGILFVGGCSWGQLQDPLLHGCRDGGDLGACYEGDAGR